MTETEFRIAAIPETPADEIKDTPEMLQKLAIEVQGDYMAQLGLDDISALEWVLNNSDKFRRAFNEVSEQIIKEEDYADDISRARQGDDAELRSAILKHVSELLSDRRPKI